MRKNDIKISKQFADDANVGYPWLRSLYRRGGEGNPVCGLVENLHEHLVDNFHMPRVISENILKTGGVGMQ